MAESKISIKFGSSKPHKPQRSQPPTTLGKRRRTGSAWTQNDSDSESDSDSGRRGQNGNAEIITGFGANGAETDRPEERKKEYIIPRQANRDWRSELRAQRPGRAPLPGGNRETQGQVEVVDTAVADQDSSTQWGLSLRPQTNTQMEKGPAETDETTVPAAEEAPPAPRTADEEALSALLGNEPTGERIIPATTEDDAYQRDVAVAGEASTLEDYEAMPVEEFGAALLRGMGWDGKERGKIKEVKRRPNQMGLGAKKLDGAEDLGQWGQKPREKKPMRLDEYRREENKRKERRANGGYREDRPRDGDRHRARDDDRHRDRYRGYDRHRDERRHDRDRRR